MKSKRVGRIRGTGSCGVTPEALRLPPPERRKARGWMHRFMVNQRGIQARTFKMADDIVEKLITEVQKKPPLFDKSNPLFQGYYRENGYMQNNRSYPWNKWAKSQNLPYPNLRSGAATASEMSSSPENSAASLH
ncbi:hypothetical protein DPX16_9465 [Anabarilius grahami]|uniref:Uncharacterized protein n=1 Tax=Anabarilius grahami TaxID=495550 RepID=A0A3N0Z5M4_ANAGA|nr:hypothetical protein DPX16_9465 [Anabarilius grahami]